MTLEERLRAVAGVWVGTYTHRAPDGAVLERFASRQETRLEGDRWYERIVYRWPDGRRRTLDFRARFDASGQQMVLDDPGFHGEAFLLGDDVLVFPYRWTKEPGRQVVETVVLSGPDRKTRVWQTYEPTGGQGNPMSELIYQHGRLSYRRKSTGAERGREEFWLTRNRGGSRTLRSVAMTDDSKFVRDVTYTLGADERPADVFVRLQVGGALVGTGYFRTEGDRLRVITDTAETGHTEQVVPVPRRFHVTTHAVMLDAWPFWAYDLAKGGEQTITVYNTSTRWNGTDGPLGRIEGLRLKLVGEEEVTVPAGTFRCRHFTLDTDAIKVPTSNIWVTGEDNLMVRYDWGELDLEYVLASWVKEQ